ncbi:helix-turn-helix transcriptional regulator [Citrobacter amalonaticus]|uniref:helix-turn-helix transcriptional regulator n=1 Tax=Citrobacter amalonaticus TaxID=35703 RepID=UPI00190387D6|nr:helix-turn-helix transcriptional regulator [Citrobacter amalonaticus]MBJ9257264.1 helix-turn-helix transcriptional regulator [Citrobacter amalonaticus]
MKHETFAERLTYAMSEAGYTQASLGQAIDMAQPSVWKLTSGKTKNTRKLYEISRVLGVRPEWLVSGEEPMRSKDMQPGNPASTIPDESTWGVVEPWDAKTPLRSDEVEVPYLKDIEFACGDGRVIDEDHNGFMLRFSKATLRKVGANSDGGGVICFPARGNSMEPNIPDGTTVAVNTNDKKIIDGKIYAINENGWKRIKILYRSGPDRVSIRSFNSAEYQQEDKPLENVEIIGRVFWWSVIDY